MLALAEIRKQVAGLTFDVTLDLSDVLKQRNTDIIAVDDIRAVGLATYDDGLYLLHYQLTYRIVLPSSRSMQPVTLVEKEVVDEVFIEKSHLTSKKEFVEQNLALVLESDSIDLKESVVDNILLAIPLRILTDEEVTEESMPSGQNWTVMTEEQYRSLQAKKRNETNPFSNLAGLFED
ncbi:YceD family protein [Streptococcus sciuri]|uniref:YceD family protein n=1 Tax=Streptococcus sciuri TaxID=2973939 RepID=A0ABT2F905_9STRE|nr:YceD family protein [Streptococcus sciuri]MCS4488857.1 YceD family protein [Streptococcus sciuri]